MSVRLAAVGILLLAAPGVVLSAMAIDRQRPPDERLLQPAFYPDAERLAPLTFGHTEIAADLAWIQLLLYYGQHVPKDDPVPWLDRITETALGLDPRFTGVYRWAVTGATWRTRVRSSASDESFWLANYYAELGIRRLPGNWEFPYLLGASYYYDRDLLPQTIYYWEIAEKMPGADPMITQRLSDIHRRRSEYEKALERLIQLRSILKEPGQIEMNERRITVLRRKIAEQRARQEGG